MQYTLVLDPKGWLPIIFKIVGLFPSFILYRFKFQQSELVPLSLSSRN